MEKISIIGCGTIGAAIAKMLDSGKIKNAKLFSLYDISFNKSILLNSSLRNSKPKLAKNLNNALINSSIIVESANQNAVKLLINSKYSAGKKLLVLSTGAFLSNPSLFYKAKKNKITIYIPSGAIAGIDGIKAAVMGKVSYVTLTTKKSPKSLGIKRNLSKPLLIFTGSAAKAVRLFPANINVAATLSLAGIGPNKTIVKIIADPALKFNIHEIEIKGDFGSIITKTENIPSKNNPKTSFLAVLSAIRELKNICED